MSEGVRHKEFKEQGLRIGGRLRALRRRHALSQGQLAEKLEVSTSYLNLIENNRRPLPAQLLIKLATLFDIDVRAFAGDEDAKLTHELMEVFADPIFEEQGLSSVDVREIVGASPQAARAVLALYEAYESARTAADDLSSRLSEEGEGGKHQSHLPSEEVSDFIQRHNNHFPALEAGAEDLSSRARLAPDTRGALRRAGKVA